MSPGSPSPSIESEAAARGSASTAEPANTATTTTTTTTTTTAPRIRFGTPHIPAPVQSPRRKSIQFNIGASETQVPSRSSSLKEKRNSLPDVVDKDVKVPAGRAPSPPPPRTYERGVSFDTFDNRDAPDFSLTLNYKHKGYQSTRRSRTFLCGTDQNDYSDFALEWLMDELVDDGDEIVCLRAIDKDSILASDAAIEAGKHRQEAERLFEQVIRKNSQDEKAISLVLELAIGRVQDIMQRMIKLYEPALLVVGTRGRSLNSMQSLLPGSVSKYCLQHSPIPVIVVRPSTKREKKKKKRLADPTRRTYNSILELSERRGSRMFDAGSTTDRGVGKLPDEEDAVAEALGLPRGYRSSLSAENVSPRSSISHDDTEIPTQHQQTGWNSLDAIVATDAERPSFDSQITARPPVEQGAATAPPTEDRAGDVEPGQGEGSPPTTLFDSGVTTKSGPLPSGGDLKSQSPSSPGTGTDELSPGSTPLDGGGAGGAEGGRAVEEARSAQMKIPVIITEDLSTSATEEA